MLRIHLLYFWGMMLFRNLALAALLIFTLQSCAQVKALEYRDLDHFRVQQVDFQQATILTGIRFYNPNGYNLYLKEGNIDVYFNDRFVGKAVLDEKVRVPAKDTFVLPATITAGLQNIVANALDMLTEKQILVRLKGSIKAGKGSIYIRVPVNYEGLQQVKF